MKETSLMEKLAIDYKVCSLYWILATLYPVVLIWLQVDH